MSPFKTALALLVVVLIGLTTFEVEAMLKRSSDQAGSANRPDPSNTAEAENINHPDHPDYPDYPYDPIYLPSYHYLTRDDMLKYLGHAKYEKYNQISKEIHDLNNKPNRNESEEEDLSYLVNEREDLEQKALQMRGDRNFGSWGPDTPVWSRR